MITPPVRLQDAQGAGWYGAPRGTRIHKGVDLACCAGSLVHSYAPGVVTKIGYPYEPSDPKKGHLRYVEVTLDGNRFRYFYILPTVSQGMLITEDQTLGIVQDLPAIYPGITPHFHFEIIRPDGSFMNPSHMFSQIKDPT